MFDPVLEVLILAAIALFVLSRLYMALGRGEDDGPVGRTEPPRQAETTPSKPATVTPIRPEQERPIFTGPAAAGMEEIYEADKSFSEPGFMRGAKAAYAMIVDAFARGDRETLKPLLDTDVYEAWDMAIAERDVNGGPAFSLLRIKKAEIESAELDGNMARVWVRYEAELGDGETTRTAREIWAFMRDVTKDDPNWILDDVEVAN